jgi:hypothetical protein
VTPPNIPEPTLFRLEGWAPNASVEMIRFFPSTSRLALTPEQAKKPRK